MSDLRKAAEMALEALEDIFGKEKKDVGAINALRQALAQPEKPSTGNVLMDAYNDTIAKKKPPVKSYCGGIANYCTPVDSAPPKRDNSSWVGLTEEERSYYLQAAANVGWWQAALFVENKLKEKNGG